MSTELAVVKGGALERQQELPARQAQPRYTLSEMAKIAELLAASGFYADCKQQAQAFAKILRGAELGIEPATALAEVQIVQGKPVLSSNLIAALIKRSGRYTYLIRKHSPEECEIEFFENGASLGASSFTMADARRANLAGKSIWQQYPENMLFARAISNGGRRFCGDVLVGVYAEGELEADYPKPVAQPVVNEPAPAALPAPSAAPKPTNASAKAGSLKEALVREMRPMLAELASGKYSLKDAALGPGLLAIKRSMRTQGCKSFDDMLFDTISEGDLRAALAELHAMLMDTAAEEGQDALDAGMDQAIEGDDIQPPLTDGFAGPE